MNYAKKSRNTKRVRRHVRIRSKVTGTSMRPRVSVYRSLTAFYAQVIDDTKGSTIVSIDDRTLPVDIKKKKPMEQARHLGAEFAKLVQGKGISTVVFDRSGYTFTGRIKEFAEGMREGGIKF